MNRQFLQEWTDFPSLAMLKELPFKGNHLIFDMDGTVFNSEPLHAKAIKDICDVPESVHELEINYRGISDFDVYQILKDRYQISLTKDEFINNKNKALIPIIQNSPDDLHHKVFSPQIRKFLNDLLKNQYTFSLVTASEEIITHELLKKFHIFNFFKNVITDADTFFTKPSCSPYLMALRHFKKMNTEVLIFEDSKTGIMAASESGCFYVKANWYL